MRARCLFLVAVVLLWGVITPSAAAAPVYSRQVFDLCKSAPEPERPGEGLSGSLDRPEIARGVIGSVYHDYGYAGMSWHTYDIGCGPIADQWAQVDTWLGNSLLNFAKLIVSAANWSHYLLQDGESLEAIDAVFESAARAMYTAVYLPFVSLALLLLAVYIPIRARGGELAEVTQRAVFALLGLALAALSYQTPLSVQNAADDLVSDQLQAVQVAILDLGGPEARDVVPTALVDTVIYRNWLRGEFGDADSPQARDFGRRLLAAQAFGKAEVANGLDTEALGNSKQADYQAVAGQLGTAYPDFQGKRGSRVGSGVRAVIQALALAALPLVANLLALAVLVLFGILAACLPLIGLMAIGRPSLIPTNFRAVLQMVVIAASCGVAASLQWLLVLGMPQEVRDSWLAMLVLFVVETVAISALQPIRKLRAVVDDLAENINPFIPQSSIRQPTYRRGLLRRPKGSQEGDSQSRWWGERRAAQRQYESPAGIRPEAEASYQPRHSRRPKPPQEGDGPSG